MFQTRQASVISELLANMITEFSGCLKYTCWNCYLLSYHSILKKLAHAAKNVSIPIFTTKIKTIFYSCSDIKIVPALYQSNRKDEVNRKISECSARFPFIHQCLIVFHTEKLIKKK